MFVCFCFRFFFSVNFKVSDLVDSFINRVFRVGFDFYESNFLMFVISCIFFLWLLEVYLYFLIKII